MDVIPRGLYDDGNLLETPPNVKFASPMMKKKLEADMADMSVPPPAPIGMYTGRIGTPPFPPGDVERGEALPGVTE